MVSEFLTADDLSVVLVEIQHQVALERVAVVFGNTILFDFGWSEAYRFDVIFGDGDLVVLGHQGTFFDFDKMVHGLDRRVAAETGAGGREQAQTLFQH